MVLIIGGAAQGKTEYAKNTYKDYEIWDDFHESVRAYVENELTREEIVDFVQKKAAEAENQLVVISNEIGMGIVPMDAFERRYRETCGRVLCDIAACSTEVVRIICQIPQKIK